MSAAAAGRLLDIRVATLPTVEGEAVTMRLLDKSREVPTLAALGLSEPMQEQMSQILARPTGALLVTGPTGSGKSTTLYAALAEISRPEINIITVEDPVEYRLAGISQVQINPRAGLTFANALRSILRSDPDVVMVGEIRDGETARISIEAAMTGHFVLSTLHTNDAPAALSRLTEMGVEPFVTGAAVSAVLAQRLARKLCTHCAEAYQPTDGRAARAPHRRRARRRARRRGLPPQEGLRSLRPDRVPRPRRRLPAPRDELAPRAARLREGLARAARRGGVRRRNALDVGGRDRQGRARRHVDRRARARLLGLVQLADRWSTDRPESPVRVLRCGHLPSIFAACKLRLHSTPPSIRPGASHVKERSSLLSTSARKAATSSFSPARPKARRTQAVPLPDAPGSRLVPGRPDGCHSPISAARSLAR